MKVNQHVSRIVIYLDFWEAFTDVFAKLPSEKQTLEICELFEKRVKRLKGVIEADTGHQVTVEFEPSAKTWTGIQREINRTTDKVLEVIARTLR